MGASISTLTVQVALAARVPPEKEIEGLPAVGTKVGVPQPLVLALGVAATTMAPGIVGKVSEKATPFKVVDGFGLVRVKVKVVAVPIATGLGAKLLLIVGGATDMTVSVDVAATPAPVLAVVTVLLVLL
jgi:hypothetical protein